MRWCAPSPLLPQVAPAAAQCLQLSAVCGGGWEVGGIDAHCPTCLASRSMHVRSRHPGGGRGAEGWCTQAPQQGTMCVCTHLLLPTPHQGPVLLPAAAAGRGWHRGPLPILGLGASFVLRARACRRRSRSVSSFKGRTLAQESWCRGGLWLSPGDRQPLFCSKAAPCGVAEQLIINCITLQCLGHALTGCSVDVTRNMPKDLAPPLRAKKPCAQDRSC